MNPDAMTVIVLLVGALQALMGVVLGFIIRSQTRLDDRLHSLSGDFHNFKAEAPVRFASEADVKRVEEGLSVLRAELNSFTLELRSRLDSMSATLHELVGANSRRG